MTKTPRHWKEMDALERAKATRGGDPVVDALIAEVEHWRSMRRGLIWTQIGVGIWAVGATLGLIARSMQ